MTSSNHKNENIRDYCQTFSEIYQQHYGREGMPPNAQKPVRMNQDDIKYLDLLSVFHYVLAGVTAVFACFPLIHLFIGIAFISGAFDSAQDAPPPFIGWIFIIIACILMTAGWSLAVLIFITAGKLKKRLNHMFCVVAAGIECIFMPFGTVLGVFTIILLNKESVKALFNQPSSTS